MRTGLTLNHPRFKCKYQSWEILFLNRFQTPPPQDFSLDASLFLLVEVHLRTGAQAQVMNRRVWPQFMFLVLSSPLAILLLKRTGPYVVVTPILRNKLNFQHKCQWQHRFTDVFSIRFVGPVLRQNMEGEPIFKFYICRVRARSWSR